MLVIASRSTARIILSVRSVITMQARAVASEMALGGRGPGLWSGGRLTSLGTNPAASALRGRMEGRSS